jgi:hypothetical protein
VTAARQVNGVFAGAATNFENSTAIGERRVKPLPNHSAQTHPERRLRKRRIVSRRLFVEWTGRQLRRFLSY